jgi:hypothetical protein
MGLGSLGPQAIAHRHDPLVLGEQFGHPEAHSESGPRHVR